MKNLFVTKVTGFFLILTQSALAQDLGSSLDMGGSEILRNGMLGGEISNIDLLRRTDHALPPNITLNTDFSIEANQGLRKIDYSEILTRPHLTGISEPIWNAMSPWQKELNLFTPQSGLESLNSASPEQLINWQEGWDRMGVPGMGVPGHWPRPPIGLPGVLGGGGEGFSINGVEYIYANVTLDDPEILVSFADNPDQSGYRSKLEGFSDILSLYRRDVIIENQIPPDKEDTSGGCSAVLISRQYALTSAHCIAISGKDLEGRFDVVEQANGAPGWSKLTLNADYKLGVFLNVPKETGIVEGNQTGTFRSITFEPKVVYLPYSVADISDSNRLKSLWSELQKGNSDRDIALIEFAQPVGIQDLQIAVLPDDDTQGYHDRITFAGYGVTEVTALTLDPTDTAWIRNLLVAGNWETGRTNAFLYWQSNGRGGGFPCSRDSGSGVFRNWRHGLAEEQRDLLAIVATVSPAPVIGGPVCASNSGKAVLVQPFKAAICAIAPGVNGCSKISEEGN